ncbi:glycosyltransferase family 17-domain-containing protein [Globomyces pollinis-pini]|nr:glycosyltransferase family 17-domain-containing protein [Globomyces pollinis-pini]
MQKKKSRITITISFLTLLGIVLTALFYDSTSVLWKSDAVDDILETNRFQTDMLTFPFDDWRVAIESDDVEMDQRYTSQMLTLMTDYLLLEPPESINSTTCKPSPLTNHTEIDCELYPNAFAGKRETPAKVGHVIQFAFDLDILEILLNELYDVVDYFFLLECTKTHRAHIQKPLMWEIAKSQKRFDHLRDKVIHLIIDDSDAEGVSGDTFGLESTQEYVRWKKFLHWNSQNEFFGDYDMIGFGDVDEIPSRENIHLIKHCKPKGPIDIGIWFPMSDIYKAFLPDFPVPGFPYTLGDPTFFPLHIAKQFQPFPNRQRGSSGNFLTGGMHMSNYAYMPYQIARRLSCSECQGGLFVLSNQNRLQGNETVLQDLVIELQNDWGDRIVPIENVELFMENVRVLPWFYDCQRDRYPVWEAKWDKRLSR